MRRRRHPNNAGEKGNAILEFSLVVVFLVPLFLGMVTVGMSLGRAIQVTQVARDAGHMFARYVDFSLNGNKDLLVRLTSGLGMTRDGGSGVVVLSQVTYIGEEDCQGAGMETWACPNYDQYVIVQRQVVGNAGLFTSRIGTPSGTSLDSSGNVKDFLRDTSVQCTHFSSILTLTSGEYAYVSEAFFDNRELELAGFVNVDPLYVRALF